MKDKNQISLPLEIPDIRVLKVERNDRGDYIIQVESTREEATCRKCGKTIREFYGYSQTIRLRHLPILGHRVYLELRPKRFQCPDCDGGPTSTQEVEWYDRKSPHTRAYEKSLLVQLINSTVEDVSRKNEVGYDAIEGIIERHITQAVNWDTIRELVVIGIDEIAMKKGHRDFAAIISGQDRDGETHILGVLADRKKDSVRQFLDTIPKKHLKRLKTVCTDMWEGYANAVREFAQANPTLDITLVVDRFHVAKNYRASVDTLRKQERKRLEKELSDEEYAGIKGTMWPLRKNNADLSDDERQTLRRLFEYSPDLKRAYTLREELTAIFNKPLEREEALVRIERWTSKVHKSGLTCFDTFLRTLDKWRDEIANYFLHRLSSGFVEGLNNKIKTIKRRCYGITNHFHLFQRIFLDLEGYQRFA